MRLCQRERCALGGEMTRSQFEQIQRAVDEAANGLKQRLSVIRNGDDALARDNNEGSSERQAIPWYLVGETEVVLKN